MWICFITHTAPKGFTHDEVAHDQDSVPCDNQSITSSQFAVLPGRAVGHNTLDLQEFLLIVIAAHDGEAEASRRLDEAGADELPL